MTRAGTKRFKSDLVWCLMALGVNALCLAERPPVKETADALMRRAVEAENAGRTNDAVTAYTLLLQSDSAFEPVVGQRLVNLHIGSHQAAPALSWAARIARKQPDPKAYLAGVHARLGQLKEAELLLRQAIREARNPHSRITLMWQMADVQEGQGDRDSALDTLSVARKEAADRNQQETATQRLEALRNRLMTAQAKQPPAGRQPAAGDTP